MTARRNEGGRTLAHPQRGNVRVVSGVPCAVVMPVVQLRRTDEPFQRAEFPEGLRRERFRATNRP